MIEDIERQARALAESGQMAQAEPLFAKLVELQAGEPAHRLNWAFSLIESGRPQAALERLQQLPSEWLDQPLPLLASGMAYLGLHCHDQAVAAFRRVHQLATDWIIASILEVRALLAKGDRAEAERRLGTIPQASSLMEDDARELAQCFVDVHQYERALQVLEPALERAPDHSQLLIILAQIRERQNKLEAAQSLLDRIAVPGRSARLLQARLSGRGHRIDEALAILMRLLDEPGDDATQGDFAEIEFEIGKWRDRRGDHEGAWRAFSSGNRIDRESHRAVFPERWTRGIQSTALIDPVYLDPALKRRRSGARPALPQAPIFLVGFPRSGTTLLDNMLNAHPSFQVLEEKLVLEPIMASLEEMTGGFPAALGTVSDVQIERWRQQYWSEVEKHIELQAGVRLIDKFPLNLLRVPLILTLFPDAEWIFAIRHPMDVVLSCFMQRFDFTEMTRGFSDPVEIARFYVAAIRIWLDQRRRLNLRCIDVRYEDVVANAACELRRVLEYLGVGWDPRVLEFDRAAQNRWVSTPSYDQVTRPLYPDSIGRWRHYRKWLSPAADLIAATALELGYDVQ